MKDIKQYIPNSLTVLRLLLAFAFPFLPVPWRLPVFIVSAITEAGDGFLARRWNAGSKFGLILDPIADKAFVFAMLLTFLLEGSVEWWEILAVGVRDIVIAGGAAWVFLFGDRSDFDRARPRIIGKLTTNFQFVFLLSALLLADVHLGLVIGTSAMSIVAAIDYIRFYLRDVRAKPEAQ